MPALERARAAAHRVSCTSRMRQGGLGCITYMNDFDEWMPTFRLALCAQSLYIPALSGYDYEPYFDYWPHESRYCPTTIAGAKKTTTDPKWNYNPRWNYNYACAWGYVLPTLQPFNIGWSLLDRTPGGVCYTEPEFGSYYDKRPFVRLIGDRPAVDIYGTQRDFDGVDSLPLIADIVYDYTFASGFYTVAHSGGDSKGYGQFPPPDGGNSLWMDGHVEWHDWTEPVSVVDARNGWTVRKDHSAQLPCWARVSSYVTYYTWVQDKRF